MAERLEEQNQLLIEQQSQIMDIDSRDQHLMRLIRDIQMQKTPWWRKLFAGPVAP
jgi:hypothetical protein